MSGDQENEDYFIGEAHASVSLLGFDVVDLDDDVDLLNNISCWFVESPNAKTPSCGVSTDSSSLATSAVSDEKVSSKTSARRRRNRTRRNCAIPGCCNRVVQGGVCVTHGAKRKLCMEEGCDKAVKKGGFCSSHGPSRKKCEVPGCSRVAVQAGICIGHGAKQTTCSMYGCRRKATRDGICKGHLEITPLDAVPAASPATAVIPVPTLTSVASPASLNLAATEYADPSCYVCPNPAVAAAVAQAPAPSLAFQKTMYARGLSIFEEMGGLGKPLPPPPPLLLTRRQCVRNQSFSKEDIEGTHRDSGDFIMLRAIDEFGSSVAQL